MKESVFLFTLRRRTNETTDWNTERNEAGGLYVVACVLKEHYILRRIGWNVYEIKVNLHKQKQRYLIGQIAKAWRRWNSCKGSL
jgi:hypothetical protein